MTNFPSIARRRQSVSLNEGLIQVSMILMHLLLVFDFIYESRLNRILGDWAQPLILSTVVLIVAFFGILAFLFGYIIQVAALLGFIWLILHQLHQFSDVTGVAYIANLGFGFSFSFTFIVFFALSALGLREYMMKWLVIYGSIYTILYLLMGLMYVAGVLPQLLLAPLTLNDVERGERLFNYQAATAFIWFYWFNLRAKGGLFGIGMAIVSGLAILLTLSRVYILCIALVTALSLVVQKKRVGHICFLLLASAAAIYLYGLLDEQWNPFAFFSGDSSGNTRILEYDAVRYQILAHPLWGIGFISDSDGTAALIGNIFFAAADVGISGVWWDFGFIGVLILLVGSYLCCRPLRGLPLKLGDPLYLTGCLMAVYGCLAPIILYPGGVAFFSIILGLNFDRRGSSEAEPTIAVEAARRTRAIGSLEPGS